MRLHLRRCLFIILSAMLLTVTAFADFGPKPQLVVKVKNPPNELYYLDLLAEGPAEGLNGGNLSTADPMYDTLADAISHIKDTCKTDHFALLPDNKMHLNDQINAATIRASESQNMSSAKIQSNSERSI